MQNNISTINTKDCKLTLSFPEDKTYQNVVYRIVCPDGFTLVGTVGDEGLLARMRKRFTSKEYNLFKPHIRSGKPIKVEVLVESLTEETDRYIIEQLLILREINKYAKDFFGKDCQITLFNMASYFTDGFKAYLKTRLGNRVLDHKNDLRYYLAHREDFPQITNAVKEAIN